MQTPTYTFFKSFLILVIVGAVAGIGIAQYKNKSAEKSLDGAAKDTLQYINALKYGLITLDGKENPEEIQEALIEKAISDNKYTPEPIEDEEVSLFSISQSYAARNLTFNDCAKREDTLCANLQRSAADPNGKVASLRRQLETADNNINGKPPFKAGLGDDKGQACSDAYDKYYNPKGRGGNDCSAYKDGILNQNSPYAPGNGNNYIALSKQFCSIPTSYNSEYTKYSFSNLLLGLIPRDILNQNLGNQLNNPVVADTNRSFDLSSLKGFDLKPSQKNAPNVRIDSNSTNNSSGGCKFYTECNNVEREAEACAAGGITAQKLQTDQRCRQLFCDGLINAQMFVAGNNTGGTGAECVELGQEIVQCVGDYQAATNYKDVVDFMNAKQTLKIVEPRLDFCKLTNACAGTQKRGCERYAKCEQLPDSISGQTSQPQATSSGGGRRR